MQQMGREEKLVIFFSTDVYHQNCSKKSVHVHVCMFVCVCKHACIDQSFSVCVTVIVCVLLYTTCECVCVVCLCDCMHTLNMCMLVCMHACVRACMCVCMCVCARYSLYVCVFARTLNESCQKTHACKKCGLCYC